MCVWGGGVALLQGLCPSVAGGAKSKELGQEPLSYFPPPPQAEGEGKGTPPNQLKEGSVREGLLEGYQRGTGP